MKTDNHRKVTTDLRENKFSSILPGKNVTDLIGMSPLEQCRAAFSLNFAGLAAYILGFFAMVFLCNFLHAVLRPLSQPRIISETIVGLIIGNMKFVQGAIDGSVRQTSDFITDFGMILYMFVVGLEMDPYRLFQRPTRDIKVAYAGMLSTFIVACSISPFLHFSKVYSHQFNISLSVILSGTASPLLTRIITDLKIGKSDIGRLAVDAGMHSDLLSTILISIGFVVIPPTKYFNTRNNDDVLLMFSAVIIQTIFTAKVAPVFMNWVNHENPEGKPMKGSHLVLSVAFVVMICSCSPAVGFNPVLSAFMAGVFLPREGRLSKMMISKVNYFLNSLFYPIYFFWVGLAAHFAKFHPGEIGTWARLVFLFVIATAGKVLGTVVSGVMLGFRWPESVALGLLLTVKGHFHMFLAITSMENGMITTSTCTVMVLVTFFTVIYTPLVVARIIERARKRAPNQRMALQWLDPSNELRLLVCLHGPHNVPSTINFIEISRGKTEPGIMVYVTDMVELTDQIAATLVHGEGADTVTVMDKSVTDMRDRITSEIQAYVAENGGGIMLRRMLALSAFNCMHQDICVLAEDLLVSLIILPYHKRQREDGKLDAGYTGFRYVNRKVLRHAPCSVGILVDRGLGSVNKISRSSPLNVAVIFIGGKDDREALAYAGCAARHTGVRLTVIRFLLDTSSEIASARAGKPRTHISEQEEEMKLDDECFAEFYDRHVAEGRISYMEKYLANSAETVSTLRAMEGQYSLFIVGRGGRVNSILTVGMSDWDECPELGPIGDILSTSDFSVTASVLIIQQHSLKGELDGLDDGFSIM